MTYVKKTAITAVICVCGSMVSASDCDFWGDFATFAQGDYEARIIEGQSDAIAQTAELLGAEDVKPGGMADVYFTKILEAIEAGQSKEAVFAVGRDVCLSYPEGTFDTDALE